ncbi:hypothetical protein WICPIJ_002171 [Wickerhamomyces pijperi]|uniref:Uncharacterized protein n=1 Tax=Wickerhamomyces pijperi TaxID=599730 RepID=A0A9P8QCD8_WICPI|nr:hypothetical protein WICPIJ_002171 [Wickerhamomyces pijperi]
MAQILKYRDLVFSVVFTDTSETISSTLVTMLSFIPLLARTPSSNKARPLKTESFLQAASMTYLFHLVSQICFSSTKLVTSMISNREATKDSIVLTLEENLEISVGKLSELSLFKPKRILDLWELKCSTMALTLALDSSGKNVRKEHLGKHQRVKEQRHGDLDQDGDFNPVTVRFNRVFTLCVREWNMGNFSQSLDHVTTELNGWSRSQQRDGTLPVGPLCFTVNGSQDDFVDQDRTETVFETQLGPNGQIESTQEHWVQLGDREEVSDDLSDKIGTVLAVFGVHVIVDVGDPRRDIENSRESLAWGDGVVVNFEEGGDELTGDMWNGLGQSFRNRDHKRVVVTWEVHLWELLEVSGQVQVEMFQRGSQQVVGNGSHFLGRRGQPQEDDVDQLPQHIVDSLLGFLLASLSRRDTQGSLLGEVQQSHNLQELLGGQHDLGVVLEEDGQLVRNTGDSGGLDSVDIFELVDIVQVDFLQRAQNLESLRSVLGHLQGLVTNLQHDRNKSLLRLLVQGHVQEFDSGVVVRPQGAVGETQVDDGLLVVSGRRKVVVLGQGVVHDVVVSEHVLDHRVQRRGNVVVVDTHTVGLHLLWGYVAHQGQGTSWEDHLAVVTGAVNDEVVLLLPNLGGDLEDSENSQVLVQLSNLLVLGVGEHQQMRTVLGNGLVDERTLGNPTDVLESVLGHELIKLKVVLWGDGSWHFIAEDHSWLSDNLQVVGTLEGKSTGVFKIFLRFTRLDELGSDTGPVGVSESMEQVEVGVWDVAFDFELERHWLVQNGNLVKELQDLVVQKVQLVLLLLQQWPSQRPDRTTVSHVLTDNDRTEESEEDERANSDQSVVWELLLDRVRDRLTDVSELDWEKMGRVDDDVDKLLQVVDEVVQDLSGLRVLQIGLLHFQVQL